MSALNELATYNKQAIPRIVEIANSFKTDIEVRLAAKHLCRMDWGGCFGQLSLQYSEDGSEVMNLVA